MGETTIEEPYLLEPYELEQSVVKDIVYPLLKVLHIWNTGGVGGILAKYMDKMFPTSSYCVMRKAGDPFSLMGQGVVWDCGKKTFYLRTLLMARKYDILHVHSLERIIPFLKFLYPTKRLILHYHGTRIRGKWPEREKAWSKADKILVSTPDLLEGAPPGTIWIPNPVDYELVEASASREKIPKAFHIDRYAVDLAKKYAEEHGLEIEVFDREATLLPHSEFLRLLGKYEYYIDVKREYPPGNRVLEALSLTGLEALACGVKVINWRNELLEGLPPQHELEATTQSLWEVYKRCY